MSTEGAAFQSYSLSRGLDAGKWLRVELVVDSAGIASVTFDGTTVLAGAKLPAACGFGRVGAIDLGLMCMQPGVGDGNVQLDDVFDVFIETR